FCFPTLPLPPRPPLFPYTPLFRSPPSGSVSPLRAPLPSPLPGGQVPVDPLVGPGAADGVVLVVLRVVGPVQGALHVAAGLLEHVDRKSTRLNSSHVKISYAVFCLK